MKVLFVLPLLLTSVMAEVMTLDAIAVDENALTAGSVLITEDEAQKSNSVTTQERLERDVSFSVTSDIVGDKTVSFRGLDYKATAYVEDGIPLFRSVNGVVDVMQAGSGGDMQLNDGSGSSTFGVSAMGGEVSFKTKRPSESIESRLETAISTNDHYYHGYVGSKLGVIYLQANADLYQRSAYTLSEDYHTTSIQEKGERVNSDKRQKRASFKLGTVIGDALHLAAKVSVSRAAYGIAPNVYTDLSMPVWDAFSRMDQKDLNSYYLYADYDSNLFHLSARAYYDDYADIYTIYDGLDYSGHGSVVTYDDSRLGGVFTTAIKDETYESSLVLLAEQNEHNRAGGGLIDETFSVNTLRASLLQLWRLDDVWQIEGALSYTYLHPTKTGVLPSSESTDTKKAVDGVLKLTYEDETSTLYGSAAKKSRMPTMNEMFVFFPWEVANPALKPERSWQGTLGYQQMVDENSLVDMSLYYYAIDDLIVYDGNGYINRESAKHYGVELRTESSDLTQQLWALSYAYAHAVDSEGDRLEHIPEHQVKLEDTVSITKDWEAYMAYRFIGSRYSRNSATYTSEQFALKSYHLVDLQVSYEAFETLTARVGIKNLLDDAYEWRYGYPAEGRSYYFSLELNL